MVTATVEQRATIITEPAEQYHARSEISRGMLADFHQRRRVYEGRYVTGKIPPKEPTKAMKIGTLVHAAILEPEKIGEMYVIIPDNLLSGENRAISKTEAKDFVKAVKAAGKNAVKAEELAMICAMAESVRSTIGPWLGKSAVTEKTLIWQHPATGILCRCKPDWYRPTKNGTAIGFDVKTTADISEHGFRNSMESFLYWMQDAHYCEGIEAVTGKPVEQFIFAAVESEEPYQTRTFQLEDEARVAGVEAREQSMLELAECMKSGNYAEAWEGTVTKVSIRGFAFQSGE
jgi:hypothetical protein